MSRRLLGAVVFMLLVTGCSENRSIQAVEPWIRGGPPGLQVMAGYMTLLNGSAEAHRLVGAASPMFESIELHRTFMEDGLAKMEQVEGAEIPSGGRLVFAPSGFHLMLMQPVRPLQKGEIIAISLEFDGLAPLELGFQVR